MSVNSCSSGACRPKVVVIGGGFAGIAVVRQLRDVDADVTLVDRNNHHLFQPFLGFGVFASVTVAPDSDIQQLPLFMTAGVSARGMFDARPRDVISLGVASGHFSENLQRAQQNRQRPRPDGGTQDYETVIELTYRFDVRATARCSFSRTFSIIQPGGTGNLKNTVVLGSQFGINF